MPILVDTTVLSNLAVVDRLDWLTLLSDTCYLASAVYDEIQRGLAEGYAFLARVDQALDSGQLLLTTLENEAEWQRYRAMPVKLQHGEAMSLAIACIRGWRFLSDDRAARAYADQLNLSYSGMLGLLGFVISKGVVTVDEANVLLHTMIAQARYRSPIDDLNTLFEDTQDADR